MLDLGFIHALKRIVALVPAKRQTLFFSATMPRAIKELADRYLPIRPKSRSTPAATTVDRIDQSVTMVNQAEKTALLTLFLQRTDVSARWSSAAPSMAPTRSSASSKRPASRRAIHGNKSQPQRERAHPSFKSGAPRC